MELEFQNDPNMTKCNRQSRMGKLLGFSNEHSSLVGNFRNLSTGYILPQFHLVSDDLSETVICTKEDDNF